MPGRSESGRPFEEYLLPAFAEGRLAVNTQPIHTGTVHARREAWNAGEWLGLGGHASLIPLALLLAAEGAWLAARLRRLSSQLNSGYQRLDHTGHPAA